eukprot:scaffold631_cov318-Pavlova_lutheri.AAC.1
MATLEDVDSIPGEDGASAMEADNVRVYLRMRPLPHRDTKPSRAEMEEKKAVFHVARSLQAGYVNHQKERHEFAFDGVLGAEATQQDVFQCVAKPVVQRSLEGFNGTVFAYGQTGSGKTFTITGGPERYEDRGIIPRAVSMVFKEIQEHADTRYDVRVSYLEIYNEAGFDLLDPTREVRSLQDLPRVSLLEGEDGKLRTRNLSVHRVENEEEALNMLFLGDTNRVMSETPMNMASTRSHCVFTVLIESRSYDRDTVRRSKLNIVDLAGSERVSKTQTQGGILNEAKFINLSLHHLEQVIIALQQRDGGKNVSSHVPYRNSLLTLVLKDSLGGNCLTTMVATASSEEEFVLESISTCRFAQRVALIHNEATLNEEEDPDVVISRLRRRVEELEQELCLLKCSDKEEGGENQQVENRGGSNLDASIRRYIVDATGEEPAPNVSSFNEVQQAFRIFREVAQEMFNSKRTGTGTFTSHAPAGQRTMEEAEREIKVLQKMLIDEDTPRLVGTGDPSLHEIQLQWPKHISPGDRQQAFEYFCMHHPRHQGIKEKMHVLENLFSSVKEVAEEATQIKSIIEHKLGNLNRNLLLHAVEESSSRGMLSDQNWKAEIRELQDTNQQKNKEAQAIKQQITHTQGLLEKSKRHIQVDFERWLLSLECDARGPVEVPSLVSSFGGDPFIARQKSTKKYLPQAQPKDGTNGMPEAVLALLTGHPEADADILRFYRAKLELEQQAW